MSFLSKSLLSVAVALVSLFLLFWKLGDAPLRNWDEARYGQNAFEMLENGDYFNYYYLGKLDLWNAKPPLMIWSIALSSKAFGFNEFSLRLPSALSGVVALLFIYLIARLFGSHLLGLMAVLTAATSRALISDHVTRTGDMDAMLIAALSIFTYGSLCYFLKNRSPLNPLQALLVTALGLGMAFYVKGFAILLWLSGWGLWVLWKERWVFKKGLTYAATLVFLTFPASWVGLNSLYGASDPDKTYKAETMIGVMLVYDIWGRFMGQKGVEPPPPEPSFLLRGFDLRFSPWFYVVLLSSLLLLVPMIRKRAWASTGSKLFASPEIQRYALQFSLVMIIPFALLVQMTAHKANWYLAPLVIAPPSGVEPD